MPAEDVDPHTLEQTKREIGRLMQEVEKLADQSLAPADFYPEFLRRVHAALAARASAMWVKSPQGNLVLQSQIGMQAIALEPEYVRPAHDELLRYTLTKAKPLVVAPNSGPGDLTESQQVTNPTAFLLVLAPVVLEGEALGVVEVFQEAHRRGSAAQGYLGFLQRMAQEAARFLKNCQYRRIVAQQQRWNQVDSFIRLIHGGLGSKQVAYLIANEGKRLIECERLAVARRLGKKTTIEAISGQDVVEKRSNLVQRLAELAGAVIKHGENLVFTGTFEEHWPGDTVKALKEYIEESGVKLIAIIPMTDQREFGQKGKVKTALIAEMIEDGHEPPEMGARLDVVSRHSALALYNALENERVFLLPVWRVLGAATQEFRGSTAAKALAWTGVAIAVVIGLIVIPWPLKMEGRGELVPATRRTVFAPVNGKIESVKVDHNSLVDPGSLVAQMFNFQLDQELRKLSGDQAAAEATLRGLEVERQRKGSFDAETNIKIVETRQAVDGLKQQIELVKKQQETLKIHSPIKGRVMDWEPKKKLLARPVEAGDPLLEIADTAGPWRLEVEFPESSVTHIARARAKVGDGRLPVTFVLSAAPDQTYHGTLVEFSTQANSKEEENVVEGKIDLDPNEDIAKIMIPKGDMVAGVEVRAKVDCGPHSLGYVLFRQVIDFIREYVFF